MQAVEYLKSNMFGRGEGVLCTDNINCVHLLINLQTMFKNLLTSIISFSTKRCFTDEV